MRKWMIVGWILMVGFSLCACRGNVTSGAGEQDDTAVVDTMVFPTTGLSKEESYINETEGYRLKLPPEIAQSCTIQSDTAEERSSVIFSLPDADMVMELCTVPEETFVENLGITRLGTREGRVTYLQLPTCGTLNREANRETWNQLVEAAKTITPDDLQWAVENPVLNDAPVLG